MERYRTILKVYCIYCKTILTKNNPTNQLYLLKD